MSIQYITGAPSMLETQKQWKFVNRNIIFKICHIYVWLHKNLIWIDQDVQSQSQVIQTFVIEIHDKLEI